MQGATMRLRRGGAVHIGQYWREVAGSGWGLGGGVGKAGVVDKRVCRAVLARTSPENRRTASAR